MSQQNNNPEQSENKLINRIFFFNFRDVSVDCILFGVCKFCGGPRQHESPSSLVSEGDSDKRCSIAQWPLLTLKTIVIYFVWYKSSTPGGIEVITLPTEESAAKLSICRTTQSSPTSTMEGLMTVSNIGIIHLRIQKRSINFSGTQVRLTSLEKQAFPNICNRTTSHAKDKMVCYECNLHSNGF